LAQLWPDGKGKIMNLYGPIIVAVSLFAFILVLLIGCQDRTPSQISVSQVRQPRIGYSPNPLLGPLYAAQIKYKEWELTKFGTSGDIGYSLIAGEIDAGFVETEKALKLIKAPGGEKLKVVGSIQFPYGATLVVRKDLKLRLSDLAGKRIAALEADCILNHQFNTDAKRHGLDTKTLHYSYMPFADMLPALEAKAIDGVLVKGAHAVLAELQRHKIIYQNWDIKAGADDCCPPSIAQTEYFLLVREQVVERVKPLIAALAAASDLPPTQLRQAISRQLGYPQAALEQYPTASFAVVTEEQRNLLGEQRCLSIR
jgi:ABC-type nitrate/sulfonate/bicarbonate transport system substrate-binding protein